MTRRRCCSPWRARLKSSWVVRLGAVKLLERVATARAEAGRETYSRVAHLLTPSMMAELDGLLHYDAAVRGTRLKWLTTPPVSDSPTAIKAEIAKLAFRRDLDAHTMDLSMLAAERLLADPDVPPGLAVPATFKTARRRRSTMAGVLELSTRMIRERG